MFQPNWLGSSVWSGFHNVLWGFTVLFTEFLGTVPVFIDVVFSDNLPTEEEHCEEVRDAGVGQFGHQSRVDHLVVDSILGQSRERPPTSFQLGKISLLHQFYSVWLCCPSFTRVYCNIIQFPLHDHLNDSSVHPSPIKTKIKAPWNRDIYRNTWLKSATFD